LSTITKSFPNIDIEVGDVSPKSVVDAFTAAMRQRIKLLYAMVNAEEHTISEFAEVGGDA
jgi:hypothetical protein